MAEYIAVDNSALQDSVGVVCYVDRRRPPSAVASSQRVEARLVPFDQCLLLRARPTLELGLALPSGGPGFVVFRVDHANGPTRCRVFRAVSLVVDPFALAQVRGGTDVERSVGAREDVDEAGSRDRRWRLALRLPIRSRGLGRSLGVAQGHSPQPVCPVTLARTSRMACHERGPLGCTGRVEWRKRLGVEPSPPAKRGATDFEDREGHRAPFASGAILPPDERVPHTSALDGEPHVHEYGMRENDATAAERAGMEKAEAEWPRPP